MWRGAVIRAGQRGLRSARLGCAHLLSAMLRQCRASFQLLSPAVGEVKSSAFASNEPHVGHVITASNLTLRRPHCVFAQHRLGAPLLLLSIHPARLLAASCYTQRACAPLHRSLELRNRGSAPRAQSSRQRANDLIAIRALWRTASTCLFSGLEAERCPLDLLSPSRPRALRCTDSLNAWSGSSVVSARHHGAGRTPCVVFSVHTHAVLLFEALACSSSRAGTRCCFFWARLHAAWMDGCLEFCPPSLLLRRRAGK